VAKSHLDKTLTALAGEFLVAGHLCLKGYVASLTLKNYPKVDIFCLNPKTDIQIAIQVKSSRGGKSYHVPENIEDEENPFVFVYINKDESVDFYILPANDVAFLSKKERDDYLHSHPAVSPDQPRMLSVINMTDYKNRWDLLGLD